MRIDECPECKGRGQKGLGIDWKHIAYPCNNCNGTGKVAIKPFPEEGIKEVLERFDESLNAERKEFTFEQTVEDKVYDKVVADALSEIKRIVTGGEK